MLNTSAKEGIANTLAGLLQTRAAEHPLATVYTWLTDGERPTASLGYAELECRAKVIAGHLQRLRLKRKIALLSYPPGLEFIEALFGCFYAGIIAVPAYVPTHKRDHPRIQAILDDAECDVALTTADSVAAISTFLNEAAPDVPCLATDRIQGEAEWTPPAFEDGDVAYLQYTSGSTASPKGVIITHANVLANLQYIAAQGGFTDSTTSVSWLPHFHDMGLIYGFLQPVFSRFPAVLFSPAAFLHRPRRWLNAISRYGATHSGAPNFAYDLCVERIPLTECQDLDLSTWQVAFSGAEPVHHQTLAAFAQRFSGFGFNASAFYPVYGLAEASLKLTSGDPGSGIRLSMVDGKEIQRNRIRPVSEEDGSAHKVVSCGRAGFLHDIVIVDPLTSERCKENTVGEIWASGPSVGAGYWKNSPETQRVFRAFLSTGEGPYLRTGDLGFLNKAELFVTGRLKDCIIIRGRNHYPQDIEKTVERSHPALRNNGTIAFSVDRFGREEVVIVSEISRKHLNGLDDIIEIIRRAVAEEHEIQVLSVVLIKSGSLPRTSSGKVQRQRCKAKFLAGALPGLAESKRDSPATTDTHTNISHDVLAAADARERRTLVQDYLQQILAAVLRTPLTQSVHTKSLPVLGADSLAVFTLRQQIENELGIDVPVDMLLTETLESVSDLILKHLESAGCRMHAVAPVKNPAPPASIPLSFVQEQIWVMQQLAPESRAYNEASAVLMSGDVDIPTLGAAINEIVSRHEILCATFVVQAGLPVQRVQQFQPIDLLPIHVGITSLDEKEQQLQSIVSKEAAQKFRLEEERPVRFKLFRLDARKHMLVIVAHHIVCDGTSLGIAIRELQAIYEAYRMGQRSPLPELKFQYTDFALWQRDAFRAEKLSPQLDYWRKQLSGISVLDLPTDYPRPSRLTDEGASVARDLPQELILKLRALSRREGMTLFMSTLATFQLLLGRYAGQRDVITGTALSNRTLAGTENLIGPFINTLVMRTHLHPKLTFSDLLKQVKRTTVEAYAHSDVPFIKLVQELVPERDLSRTPLFQTLLVFQPPLSRETQEGARGLTFLEVPPAFAKFDLSLMVTEDFSRLRIQLEYRSSIFKESSIQRMLSNLQFILESMTANPERRISELSLLSENERHQILIEWNQTRTALSEECIHHLVEKQSAQTPEAVAVSYRGQSLTYAELNRQSNQLAHYLCRLGVRPEVRVGVCVARDKEMIVALLAILKAGGVYVPLDPEYPRERIDFMLEESQAAVLLVSTSTDYNPTNGHARIIHIDASWKEVLDESAASMDVAVDAQNLAYVIYTSGSTGKPKGIGIQHGSAVTFLNWCRETFQPEDLQTVLACTSISFDLSIFEIFAPLTCGGRLVLARNALELPELQERESITLVNTVPSAISELLGIYGLPSSVRTVNLAGEALSPGVVEKIYQFRQVGRVFNLYGPSEDTTYSTYALCGRREQWDRVPIGKPIANTQLYVVDEEMEPVGVGTPGELYIGGAGLARGYLSQPALTAERFLPNPFSEHGGERLYRTGDRVRWRSDGKLDFLGRLDEQVKVRGYRIELGEIEAVLKAHRGVAQAAVLAHEGGHARRLVAYVVTKGDEAISSKELRQYVRGKLPEYMVPSAWMLVDQLPLLPNGKLDRKALPEPVNEEPAGAETGALVNAAEEILCGIFAEVLKRQQVGVEENFFEIGGHSLLATQVISRVREAFGVELPLRAIFEQPTVRRLEEQIVEARAGMKPTKGKIRKISGEQSLPLSYAQQRLWFLAQLEPGSAAYNMPFGLRLKGELNRDAAQRSLNEIVRRHEVLRTSFPAVDGKTVQKVAAKLELVLEEVNVSATPAEQQEEEVRKHAREEAARCFDLERGPLLRARLLRLGKREHVLLGSMHHIVSDGWSIAIMQREFMQLYESYMEGQESSLPNLELQYADYAAWQRESLQGDVLNEQVTYWRKQLNGLENLDLPADHRRSDGIVKAHAAKLEFHLAAELTADLRNLSRREGVTLFMTVLAAFQLVLSKYTAQTDVAVGTVVANRNHLELESLIGFFVNTLVLRTQLNGDPDFAELLRRVRQVCLQAYQHQDVPFDKLVEELRPDRQLSSVPFFKVMLVLQNTPKQIFNLHGLEMSQLPVDLEEVKFELVLNFMEIDSCLTGEILYRDDIFETETIERLARHLLSGLQGMLAKDTRISSLQLLSENERRQILVDWNQTAICFPCVRCIHELVEGQAAKTPNATAVVFEDFEDTELSYEDLNRKANQLAHYLQRLGVRSDVPVGICVKRSPEMVIGLLAILKAGGAYVPLDPEYPAKRLTYMLQDAQVKVLITQAGVWARSGVAYEGEVIVWEQQWGDIAQQSAQPVNAYVEQENLAYVIYTSGSTGRPKPVGIMHRGLSNLVRWHVDRYGMGEHERTTQCASPGFDAAVWEIWPVLTAGGTLEIMPDEVRTQTGKLPEWLREKEITIAFLATPVAQAVLGMDWPEGMKLRTLLTGGDRLHAVKEDRYGFRLVNHYGPTEITVVASAGEVECGNHRTPAIGKPIANTRVYVLDETGEAVPVGTRGELYIGGAGLARGYLNRPDATAEKFVPDRFSGQAGQRLYRTGDLVRWKSDGNLDFLGRRDHQVKIRGYRIELGEIESALESHGNVDRAVVVVREDERGVQRLAAYVALKRSEAAENVATGKQLREYLKERLPGYMVPAVIMEVESFPLTANAKIDRNSLPEPEMQETGEAWIGPRNRREEILVGLWEEVLRQEGISIDANFFEMGGHSLLATQLISRVHTALGVELPLRVFFEAPTVEGIGNWIEQQRIQLGGSRIPALEREQTLALSYAQQRLWFIDQLEPGTTAYNVSFGLRLKGVLDKRALGRAVNEIVERHEVLRTTFLARDGVPVQQISERLELRIEEVDLSGLAGEDREAEAKKRARVNAATPFSLSTGPLLRVTLLRLSEKDHLLLLNMHHIITDGWSMRNMVREFASLYITFMQGREPALPNLKIQYRDFGAWQRRFLEGGVLQEGLAYWRKRLEGAPTCELPSDFAPSELDRHPAATITRELSKTFTQKLREVSTQEGASLFMMLLATFQVVLGVFIGREDVVVGTDIANRRGETEELIGFFANQLALRADLRGDLDFRQFLRRTRANLLQDFEYQDIPFDKVVQVVSSGARSSMSPLFGAKLVLQNVPEEDLSLPELQLGFVEIEQDTAKFDLLLTFVERNGVLKAAIEYRKDLLSANTVAFLWSQISNTLAAVCDEPGISLEKLRQQLNAAQTSYRIKQKAELTRVTASRLSPMVRKRTSLTQAQMSDLPAEPHAN